MNPAIDPNEPESRGGVTAMLRAIGALAVLVAAMIGILVVLDVIPAEALNQWLTKAGLVLVIVVAAAIAIWALARAGGGKPSQR